MNKTQALALAKEAFGPVSYLGAGQYCYMANQNKPDLARSITGTYQQTLSRRAAAIAIQALILMGIDDKAVMLECYDIANDVGSAAKRLTNALARLAEETT